MKAMLRRDQEEGRKHALLMEGARGSGGFVQAHAMAQPGGGVYSPLDVRYGSPISALWGETSYGEGGGSPFKRGEQMYK
jgi:hypothetical protein